MFGSSESWGPQQHPHPWHFRAGGGAVHSIKSGLTHRSKKAPLLDSPRRRGRAASAALRDRAPSRSLGHALLFKKKRKSGQRNPMFFLEIKIAPDPSAIPFVLQVPLLNWNANGIGPKGCDALASIVTDTWIYKAVASVVSLL